MADDTQPRRYGWTEQPARYCNARHDGLACDLLPGHPGTTHVEQGVATWTQDGEIRWAR